MMKSSMSKIETNDVMVGPVVSEGGRSPSTLSPGHGGEPDQGFVPCRHEAGCDCAHSSCVTLRVSLSVVNNVLSTGPKTRS